jgi:hypothetical protein
MCIDPVLLLRIRLVYVGVYIIGQHSSTLICTYIRPSIDEPIQGASMSVRNEANIHNMGTEIGTQAGGYGQAPQSKDPNPDTIQQTLIQYQQ